jgi:hypothetical protein
MRHKINDIRRGLRVTKKIIRRSTTAFKS